ncbi:MAG TPA: carboxymuconolactone decarboxylase family protein [Acidimicrobiales bacterium]|jgi:alkylhydroperoxidase/carboxymuconolactone decarboxylase family protein YurZ|nr:carboxymuconolactone decarboxylase family protein [Acidimicrobiales bacterium]
MPTESDTHDLFRSVAQHDADALEGLLFARVNNQEASGLDARTYALVNIAALVAADASPASYVWQVGLALDSGVTADEILGVLVAVGPTVGNVRVVAAAAEIAFALGVDLDVDEA